MTHWEEQEQSAFVQWCDIKHIPIFAIPNGGSRDVREAANLKRAGVKAGVPDLFIPVPMNGKHGLFIEMKHGNNRPTKSQLKWLELLAGYKYTAIVCYGVTEAILAVTDYLKTK